MKPQAHVFLLDSQLFVTTETLPEKPKFYGSEFNTEQDHDNYAEEVEEYISALASIRERAVLADWSRLDVYTLDKYAHGESGGPEFWVHKGDGNRVRIVEGEFYPIDCEVRYEERIGPSMGNDEICTDDLTVQKVAILSPIEAPGENIDYDKLRSVLKDLLSSETTESLCQWLEMDRNRMVKEESQDELWDQVYNISKSMGRNNARVLYKELFTITRNK